jgi:hypothetical protein
VTRKLLGLKGNAVTFDFHWCDNPADLKDPISLCTNGDSAPNRRFIPVLVRNCTILRNGSV